MASHLAAQDYLARLQASGLNFPQLGPAELQYAAALGLPPLSSPHHKKSAASKAPASLSRPAAGKDKLPSALAKQLEGRLEVTRSNSTTNTTTTNCKLPTKYPSGLTIQPSVKVNSDKLKSKSNELNYHLKSMDKKAATSSGVKVSSQQSSPSIFTSPLSLASNYDKSSANTISTHSASDSASLTSSSVLRWVLGVGWEDLYDVCLWCDMLPLVTNWKSVDH